MTNNSENKENMFAAWTVDFFGPAYKKYKHLTLKQVRSKFFVRCPFIFYVINIKLFSFNFFNLTHFSNYFDPNLMFYLDIGFA